MRLATALLSFALSTASTTAQLAVPALPAQPALTTIETTGITPVQSSSIPASILVSIPSYDVSQCDAWLTSAKSSDADGSGGLNEDEYYNFLTTIGNTDYFRDKNGYKDLDWTFKITHKALSCRCVDLGMGSGCCKGSNAEIPYEAIMMKGQGGGNGGAGVAGFRDDLCNSIAAVFLETVPEQVVEVVEEVDVGSTPPPTTTTTTVAEDGTTDSTTPTTEVPPDVTMTDVTVKPSVPTIPKPDNSIMEGKGTTVLNIIGSVLDYSSFDYSVIFEGIEEGIPQFYNAAGVMGNLGQNEILPNVIKGFGSLSNELLGELGGITEEGKRRQRRGLRGSFGRKLEVAASLKPVVVTDIACPDRLTYAPKDTFCLNFKFVIDSKDLSDGQVTMFSDSIKAAIDEEGRLYDAVLAANPDTLIRGLGNPGKGVSYQVVDDALSTAVDTEDTETDPLEVSSVETLDTAPEDSGGGLSNAAIVFIVLAVMFIPIAIVAMFARYRKVQNEERLQRLAEYNESQHGNDLEAQASLPKSAPVPVAAFDADGASDSGSVISVSDHDGGANNKSKSTAGSSLAAMGAAGMGASMINRKDGDDDAIRAEIEQLCKETNTPKSADEMLKSYAGREQELLKNLRKLKAQQTKEADIRAEVQTLVKETNAPKSADEMLASYKGREEELLSNLRKMKSRQQSHEEKQSIRAEVEKLVEETGAPKSVDELLATYEGREDALINNLKKMKAKQERDAEVIAEIRTLVKETNAPKTADEMLASYAGREEKLLANLKKMKGQMDKNSNVKAEVEQLVKETGAPKTADELLASYAGREDDLLKNLRTMKEKQEKDAEIRAEVAQLAKDTNAPKSADEMLASYKGKEEELLKNLRKTKENQLAQSQQQEEDHIGDVTEKDAEMRAEVEELIVATGAPKTADEMLASYKGREDELLKNLRKMKKKLDKEAKQEEAKADEDRASIVSEVTSLVEETNPGKSAEEMLAAYEGREEDLLKNLKKMKAKQDKAVASARASEAPAASAPAAAEASATSTASVEEEVAALVEATKPGKSATELLTAYEGREEELVSNLKKLKASKRNLA